MAVWKRGEQNAFLRVIDAVTALLVTPAGREPAGRLVAERLVAIAFELLAGEGPEEEAERASAHLARLTAQDAVDEATVRGWLREALRVRAEEFNATLWEDDWGRINLREHDAWALLDLSPLARRIRLWAATMKLGATALGSAIGVPPHQVGHWATGRSRPRSEHRVTLAEALGVHPAWLSAARDLSADSDLLLHRACPCGSGAALVPGPSAHSAYLAEEVPVVWCAGCGQPHAALGASGLIPLPGTTPAETPDEYPRFRAAFVERGYWELEQAWPHAVWCPGTDTVRRGPVRVPALLTVPPFTPALPAPPPRPAANVPHRRLGGGPEPQRGIARSGLERIQALLTWVGDGRRLTEKGNLTLADARMLVEALPTGDRWDPVEYGYQLRTRSSAELSNLSRLLRWCFDGGLLWEQDRVLTPTTTGAAVRSNLGALGRILTDMFPRVALADLAGCFTLGPLSDADELAMALTVLWDTLRAASTPVAPEALVEAIWAALTDGDDEVFEEPERAKNTVRRDVGHLLTLSRDLDLVADVGDLVELGATGRRHQLPTW